MSARYYDPVKEEIEERTARIKREMEGAPQDFTPGNIRFERKVKAAPSSSFLQLLIAALLGIMIFGWLFYGNQILYVLWLVIPIYLYFRLKKNSSSKR